MQSGSCCRLLCWHNYPNDSIRGGNVSIPNLITAWTVMYSYPKTAWLLIMSVYLPQWWYNWWSHSSVLTCSNQGTNDNDASTLIRARWCQHTCPNAYLNNSFNSDEEARILGRNGRGDDVRFPSAANQHLQAATHTHTHARTHTHPHKSNEFSC